MRPVDPIHLYDRVTRAALRASGFKSKHLETSVGKVHVLDASGEGAAPPVAVLHGFSAHATQYGAILRRLRKLSRRVLAPALVRAPRWLAQVPVTAMGALAVYWCLDRATGLF